MQFFDSPASFDKGAFVCGVRVWGLHGRFAVAASGHGGQRAGHPTFPFSVGCRRGAPTPPKLAAGRMLRDWQTVGADFHIRPVGVSAVEIGI